MPVRSGTTAVVSFKGRLQVLVEKDKLTVQEAASYGAQERIMREGALGQRGVAGIASDVGMTITELVNAQADYVVCHADRHSFDREDAFIHRFRVKGGWSEYQVCKLCGTRRFRLRNAALRIVPKSYSYDYPADYRLGQATVSKNDWDLIGQYTVLLQAISQLEAPRSRKLHAVG